MKKIAQWTMSKPGGHNQEPKVVVKFTPPIVPADVKSPGFWAHPGAEPVVYGLIETTDRMTYLTACDQNGKEISPYYSATVLRYKHPISAAEFLRELGYAYRRPKMSNGEAPASYGRDAEETIVATPMGGMRQRAREESCSPESKIRISTIAGAVGLAVGGAVGWTLAKRA